jgi:hypothetical protein
MTTKRNLIIFTVITLASGWLGVLLDMVLTDRPEGNSPGGLWLILPLLTAMVLRLISRDRKDTGLKLNLNGNAK